MVKEMDLGSRRVVTSRTGVVAGSVWESRMKVDQVRGGIKVYNGDDNPQEIGENSTTSSNTEIQVYKRMRPKQGLVGMSGKRKTWKTENSDGADKNPIQIARQRSELTKNLDGQCKELSVSADRIKKSPIKIAKGRSELSKNLDEQSKESSVSADGIKKSPIQTRKTRSEVNKELNLSVDGMEKSPSFRTRSIDGGERNSVHPRKVKYESNKASSECRDGNERNAELRKVKSESDESFNGNGRNSIQLTKSKSVSDKVLDESGGNLSSIADTTERKSVELRKPKFESNDVVDESRKVVEESTQGTKKCPSGIAKTRSDDENCKEFGECEEKVSTSNIGSVSQAKSPPKLLLTNEYDNDWDEESVVEEIEVETVKKSFDVMEISSIPEQNAKKIVIEEKKIHQSNVKSVLPISPIVKKQLPPVPRIVPKHTKNKQIPFADEFQRVPKRRSKLQSLVDLVMWRDVSKSAFIFGLGTFIIISSSCTTDINISLITVLSYLGLVYLAAIFLFRSIICRGAINEDDTSQDHVVGEEEALWLLKLILPYINEFLLKLRALFSGDPPTTMKLAVLLFVLARCGSSITIWKMTKLGFFGVFTVPKICSSYSSHLTAFGTFWIQRFKDAWESCSHKKGVGFFIFTVVWNLSSIVARIWAVFILFVAFRYYQQQYSLIKEEEDGQLEKKNGGNRRQGHRGPTLNEIKTQNNGS